MDNPTNIDDILDIDVEDLLNEFALEIVYELTPEVVGQLDELIADSTAKTFTDMMNKKYEEENQVDEDGAPLRLEVPSSILKRSWAERDGSLSFKLTSEEDRWFRADHVFGSRLLEKLNLTYIVEE